MRALPIVSKTSTATPPSDPGKLTSLLSKSGTQFSQLSTDAPPATKRTFPHTLILKGSLSNSEGQGLAFLSVDGRDKTVGLGEAVVSGEGWKLTSVRPREIEIGDGHHTILIKLGETQHPTIPMQDVVAQPQIVSPRSWRGILDQPSTFANVRAKPVIRNGLMVGVRLSLPSGHVLSQLGLKTGDIVLAVNGKAVGGPGALSRLLPMIRNSRTLVFELERAGEPQTVRFQL